MSISFDTIEMSSFNSSNRVYLEDLTSFSVAALPGSGEKFGLATIPHAYGSDNLMVQVSASTTTGGTGGKVALPWESSDGRVIMYASVDATNLYIACISTDASGSGAAARTVNCDYKLLIP